MSEQTMAPQMSGDEIPPEEEKRQRRKRRKKNILIAVNLLGLIIIVVLGFLLFKERKQGPVAPPSPSPKVTPSPSPAPTATPSALLERIDKRRERLDEKIEATKKVEEIKPPILDFDLRFKVED